MILLASILIVLGVAALMWWAFGPWDEGWYPREDGKDYFPFWSERK